MGCLTKGLKGLAVECDTSLAGIEVAYIGEKDNFEVAIDKDTMTITGITGTTGSTETAKLYAYHFNRQTGSLNSEMTRNDANGSFYYTNTVALQFTKMEAKKSAEIAALAKAHSLDVVKDLNGQYWVVGADTYATASADTAQSGQSVDDLNGYNITLDSMSAYKPLSISYDLIRELIVEPA